MADLDLIFGLVQDIKDQLDGVEEKCEQLVEFKAVHTEAHKTIEANIISFKKTLYGDDNGTGLTYEIQKLRQCKNAMRTSSERWRNFWMGVLKTLATAAIIAVTAWLLSVYRSQGQVSKAAGAEISQQRGNRGQQ